MTEDRDVLDLADLLDADGLSERADAVRALAARLATAERDLAEARAALAEAEETLRLIDANMTPDRIPVATFRRTARAILATGGQPT
jgi:outer membrane protein TolC